MTPDEALQTLQTLFTAALKAGVFSDAETVAHVSSAVNTVKMFFAKQKEITNDTTATT